MNRLTSKVTKVKNIFQRQSASDAAQSLFPHNIDKPWLDLQFHDDNRTSIKKPNELEHEMQDPPVKVDEYLLDKIQGSLIGMALGDALGAHVEFRPHEYLVHNPVTDFQGGGTWNLEKGQFTDDTSMALCLANSLVTRCGFCLYDQLVRYKWWYRKGYMSSTGKCFDIGAATKDSLHVFEDRQRELTKKDPTLRETIDYLSTSKQLDRFDVYCSGSDVAGNGALMRLAPVPLFFHRHPESAVKYSGRSGRITHGDRKAYDACRYYGALIVAALNGYTKEQLLSRDFYSENKKWFGGEKLCSEIKQIARGSYQKQGGYDDGIRGKGYIVNALEAALWAFWSDNDSFRTGALAAVNLGDDTDTTAAIYGQLAGAVYGFKRLPQEWIKQVYAKKFILNLSSWIVYEGENWDSSKKMKPITLLDSSSRTANGSSRNKSTSDVLFSSNLPTSNATVPSGNSRVPLALRATISGPSTDEINSGPIKAISIQPIDSCNGELRPNTKSRYDQTNINTRMTRGYSHDNLSDSQMSSPQYMRYPAEPAVGPIKYNQPTNGRPNMRGAPVTRKPQTPVVFPQQASRPNNNSSYRYAPNQNAMDYVVQYSRERTELYSPQEQAKADSNRSGAVFGTPYFNKPYGVPPLIQYPQINRPGTAHYDTTYYY